MDRLVKEDGFYLGLLLSANKRQQKRILHISTIQQLRALVEIIYNVLHGYMPPHEKHIPNLKRHKSAIRDIVKKKISRRKRIELISKNITVIAKLLEVIKQGIVIQWRKN
ncbi:MAG: hypothetical protein ABW185_24855 [Sedimenticola sp.]